MTELTTSQKAAIAARYIDAGYYDYFDRCYLNKGNNHYYTNAEGPEPSYGNGFRPISRAELAKGYDELMQSESGREAIAEIMEGMENESQAAI